MSSDALKPPQVAAPSLSGLAIEVRGLEPVSEPELFARLHAMVRDAGPAQPLAAGATLEAGDEVELDGIVYVGGAIAADGFIERQSLVLDEDEPLHWLGLKAGLIGTALGATSRVPMLGAPAHPIASLRGRPAVALVTTRQATRPEAVDVESAAALERIGAASLPEALRLAAELLEHERAAAWYAGVTQAALAAAAARAQVELKPALIDGLLEKAFDDRFGRFVAAHRLSVDEHAQARSAFVADPTVREDAAIGLKGAAVLRSLIDARVIDVEKQSPRDWLERLLGVELADAEAEQLMKQDRLAAQRFLVEATWLAGLEGLLERTRVTITAAAS